MQTTSGVNYVLGYGYFPVGLASETYPSLRTVTTTYDGAGRPSQVSGILSGARTIYTCEPSVPTSCVLYAAHGAVVQVAPHGQPE